MCVQEIWKLFIKKTPQPEHYLAVYFKTINYQRLALFCGEGNGDPLQYSCLENPMDRGAWWAAVHGVMKSWTRLSDFTFTFHFHALEEEMATHSSVLAWRIPGTGEPGGLLSMGSHRVGHDWSDLAVAAAAALFWDTSLSSLKNKTKQNTLCYHRDRVNLTWSGGIINFLGKIIISFN